MSSALILGKFSFGMGDRFAHQAKAQLQAVVRAASAGVTVTPVWNKSNREHTIIGSRPPSVRQAAERAVRDLGWSQPWHVDADHIRLETVDAFLESSDFFTIDVADSIGKSAPAETIDAFVRRHPELTIGRLEIPGIDRPLPMTREETIRVARKYLFAVREAGAIFRHIEQSKGSGKFIAEVSMDETDSPQSPTELLIILTAMADEQIALQTIAPKFTGRFNKGVDYVGDLAQFEREFNEDLAVIDFAIQYGLPKNLKLSVHSGSDKFSIYAPIRRALARFNAGLHLKTAGTTWLEEVIGLAEAGGDGLALAKDIYAGALEHRHGLCGPYATVIDIDPSRLPSDETVSRWTSAEFTGALRHDPRNPEFNPHFRQLLHVGFKIAAKQGDRYLKMLETCEPTISRNVTLNLFERHLKPLFLCQ